MTRDTNKAEWRRRKKYREFGNQCVYIEGQEKGFEDGFLGGEFSGATSLSGHAHEKDESITRMCFWVLHVNRIHELYVSYARVTMLRQKNCGSILWSTHLWHIVLSLYEWKICSTVQHFAWILLMGIPLLVVGKTTK